MRLQHQVRPAALATQNVGTSRRARFLPAASSLHGSPTAAQPEIPRLLVHSPPPICLRVLLTCPGMPCPSRPSCRPLTAAQLEIKRQGTQIRSPEASMASGTQDYVQARDAWDLPTRLASVQGPSFRQACAAVAHSRRNLGEEGGGEPRACWQDCFIK